MNINDFYCHYVHYNPCRSLLQFKGRGLFIQYETGVTFSKSLIFTRRIGRIKQKYMFVYVGIMKAEAEYVRLSFIRKFHNIINNLKSLCKNLLTGKTILNLVFKISRYSPGIIKF